MRILLLAMIALLYLTSACGNDSEAETSTELPDSTGALETVNSISQEPPSGAYNIINEAQSVTDQANDRTEQLEQLMGDE